jgi:hypothetical protein
MSSDLSSLLDDALQRGTFVALVLSRPVRRGGDAPRKLSARPIDVRGERRLQWTSHFPRRETHNNLTTAESHAFAAEQFPAAYRHAHLFTTEADYTLRASRRGDIAVTSAQPSKATPPATHDRQKQYLIPEGVHCPFLAAIGVMTADGAVRAKARHKFRQINRFLEFVEDIYSELPAEGTLRVIDFGCGKSYLTFAVHHLLTNVHGRDVDIVGLDREESVIRTCRDVTAHLGLAGLRFEVGDIAGFDAAGRVHLAISLHACDTATDDALAQAVRWEADVILAAPCCQHELAAKMRSDALSLLTTHGILKERLAALATDALRACALEIAGYRTQVIEFIDLEHTPKNVLIRAVRRDSPTPDELMRMRFERLKRELGVESIHLEDVFPRNRP